MAHKILLVGSTGYLGQALMLQLQPAGQVIPTHRSRALFKGSWRYDFWTDILSDFIQQERVDTVVIAASMAGSAVEFTVFQQCVQQLMLAIKHCRVIYISSDGIFSGRKGNYTEEDIPDPITSYGRNLHYFEQIVQQRCANYCIIRPSYLYGYSQGKLDSRLSGARESLLAGKHLTYFSDMLKSPMEVNQVARAIVVLTLSNYIGIVHVAGPAVSIYDFYREAMKQLGISCQHLHAELMPADFPHPRDTSLNTSLLQTLTGIEPLSIRDALHM
ncbi:NAD(P)-dependent oxidoreductase [Dictyobacter vulcani]|uniref:NAD(P)-dependent oxidoreductase n=1 Tax=Dictyobacter vulcani TaxID=2607529 RepID=A0A5J4KS13_9CHLR|nr:sugar nucleotide-binding protein [Dictyobacter vulcani]GER90453.1 NAD(P)-dependent oxidoreductase [Dictyobacter vulcani]